MIKFDELDELFDDIYIEQDEVVFYLDLYSVICRCYQNRFAESIEHCTDQLLITDFVIGILNVLAHYRKYTTTRLRKKSSIVVTFDTKLTKYQKNLYPKFRWDRIPMMDTDNPLYGHLNKIVREAYKYLQSICVYFEGIYVIDYNIGVDSLTIVAMLRNTERFKNCYHVIFNRNMQGTQLISHDTCILFHRKEHTKLLTEKNCLTDGLLWKARESSKKKYAKQISPSMIPFIAMMGGCIHVLQPLKGVNCSVTSAVRIVYDLLQEKQITRGVSLQSFLEALEKYKIDKKSKKRKKDSDDIPQEDISGIFFDKEHYNAMIDRYRVFSIPLNCLAATKDQILKVYQSLIDVYDQNYLEKINDMLSRIGDDERLISLDVLNGNTPYTDEDYSDWW